MSTMQLSKKSGCAARRALHLRSIRTGCWLFSYCWFCCRRSSSVSLRLWAACNPGSNRRQSARIGRDLKQGEINAWVQSLQLDLSVEPTREQDVQRLVTLLANGAG